MFLCLLSEIGNTISNLFGGGKTEETGEVKETEGSFEEIVSEVICASVAQAVFHV